MELNMGPGGKIPGFLKKLMGIPDDDDFEVVEPLEKDEAELYNKATCLQEQMEQLQAKTENTYKLFWATVRDNRDLHNAGSLRMNDKTGMIEMRKEDPTS